MSILMPVQRQTTKKAGSKKEMGMNNSMEHKRLTIRVFGDSDIVNIII